MAYKIASYNIMSGGFRDYDLSTTHPVRLSLIQEAISNINADFIGLIDTYRWDEIYTKKDLKKLFDYSFVYCISLEDQELKKVGHNNGITILTNLKVEGFQTIHLYDRNGVLTKININGKMIDIFSIYLNHASEEIRLKQTNALLKKTRKENTLIHGDLNSFSPDEFGEIKKQISDFFLTHSKYKEKYLSMIEEMLKGKVLNTFYQNGFRDFGVSSEPTAPTPLFGKNVIPFLRLDYFLATPDLKANDYIVHRGELFDKASDHYPISLTLDV